MNQIDKTIRTSKSNAVQQLWSSFRQDVAHVTQMSTSDSLSNFSKQTFPDVTLQNLNKDNPDIAWGVFASTSRGSSIHFKLGFPINFKYKKK